jgi:hypothetical protein
MPLEESFEHRIGELPEVGTPEETPILDCQM